MSLTATQMENRARGLGGSDAGAVLGLNPYRSPVQVYLEKTGQAAPFEGNERTYWGQRLEDVIADEYGRRHEVRVRRRNVTFASDAHPHMLGHIDRSVDGRRMVLECKNASQYMASEWGEPGTDEVPESYLVQTAHYLIVTGYSVAALAVLIGGNEYRDYLFERDPELDEYIIEGEYRFWHEHVLPRVPPPAKTADDVMALYARDDGSVVVASDEAETAAIELAKVKAQLKDLEGVKEQLETAIKIEMGPASEIILGADGKPIATWKAPKESERLDAKALAADHPEIAARYMRTVASSRRFLLKTKA